MPLSKKFPLSSVGFSIFVSVLLTQACNAHRPFLHETSSIAGRNPAQTDSTQDYPIRVIGGDESSLTPSPPNSEAQLLPKTYDVIVVGGGLSGLSNALFVSDQKKSVLLLEKENSLGGLASASQFGDSGIRYDRGAAYWTSAYEEEGAILKRIGLGDFEDKYAIPEPIDSYLWNGKLYQGIWDAETLKALPASFAVFKRELKLADKAGLIPNQPIEDADDLSLDQISAAQWIRQMPERLFQRTDTESKQIQSRYREEIAQGKLDPKDPMKAVIQLMNLYCRSALGDTTGSISAVAFANFYISEIETRYSSSKGTGLAAQKMIKILDKRTGQVNLQTSSAVTEIKNFPDHVEVTYQQGGHAYRVRGSYVAFSAQLKIAPKIIDHFAEEAPEQAALIHEIQYADYSVHGVEVKGHPYRASYDTWSMPADYSPEDFTDVILGRWMEKGISGYEGYRDFRKDPQSNAIMTIYHPLSLQVAGQGYTDEQARSIAKYAVDRMIAVFNPVLKEQWNTSFEVLGVETSRWPFSIHVAVPGHFTNKVKILRRPFKRVFFGNNNLGTPAFEEALFRGHCAANNILTRLIRGFKQERWSRCPLESGR